MAAVEYTLLGMKADGYREVRTSPHLAYREKSIPNLIPGNAVLILTAHGPLRRVCRQAPRNPLRVRPRVGELLHLPDPALLPTTPARRPTARTLG